MHDIVEGLAGWFAAGRPFALATVVATQGSAPRPAGASMAVTADGQVLGSVSGGCVEAAVHAEALEVLGSGRARSLRYGVTADGADLSAPGLTCGGTVRVFVRPIDPRRAKVFPDLLDAVRAGVPAAWLTVLDDQPDQPVAEALVHGDGSIGSLGTTGLDAGVFPVARALLAQGGSQLVHVGSEGEQRRDQVGVFVHSFAAPPRLLIFGSIDFAAALAGIGRFLGFHVTVCDARPTFTTAQRFPDVDELVVDWPHRYLDTAAVDERTVICVLTHDPKFDIPLLQRALATPAGYIGVMGSRRTHADRLARLTALGVTPVALQRLSAPIGLDIGACTPQETAVAIAAEIIAARAGLTATRAPLSRGHGPVHPRQTDPEPLPWT